VAKVEDCVAAAVRAGRITAERGKELLDTIDAYERQLALFENLNPEQRRARAVEQGLDTVQRRILVAQRQAAKQASATKRTTVWAQMHPEGTATGVASILGRDVTGKAPHTNVDFRTRAILAQAHATFADGLEALRTKALGFWQDTDLAERMVRELFGEATGDAEAGKLAKLWTETSEAMRQRFNQAGGAILKRKDWGLPQRHDRGKVMQASQAEWVAFVKDRLDTRRTFDAEGNPINPGRLEEVLRSTYDGITTGGLDDLIPGEVRLEGKVANRHQQARELAFKNANAWMEYQRRFGAPHVFHALTEHMERMARETALIEVLGPNPAAQFRYLSDLARADGAGPLKLQYLESLYNVVGGVVDRNSSAMLADVAQTMRNVVSAARLGAAVLSSTSDLAFIRQTAKWNGLSAWKVHQRQIALMNPRNEADRLMAVKAGLAADAWTRTALAANRWTDVAGYGFSARAADFTMRASGMTAWTDAGRKAFGIELMGLLAEHQGKVVGELPEQLQRAFESYGIRPEEWDVLRATKPLVVDGVPIFSFENLMARQDLPQAQRIGLATKMQEFVHTEMQFAVPEPDARTRAIITGGHARGTPVGELMRGVMQFKSFPVAVIASHLYRAGHAGTANGAAYLAELAIATTLMGAVAMQLKDVSRGRDPRPMDTPKAWAAAFTQGGGAGIYGDFLFADANRFGGGPIQSALGPQASLIGDTWKLGVGNLQEVVRGEDTNIAAETVKYLAAYAPGSSLWYSRAAFDRAVVDQLTLATDPSARAGFVRQERERMRDYQQRYWWRPGQPLPSRGPDLEKLVED
jgi:hypothetical protein